MKKLSTRMLFVVPLLVLLWCMTTLAQRKPGGTEKGATSVLWRQDDIATIETTVPGHLAEGSSASLRIYKKEGNVSKRIVKNENVPNCGDELLGGEICKDTSEPEAVKFLYRFSSVADSSGKYDVAFDITDAKKGEVGQIVDVAQIFSEIKPDVQPFYKGEDFTTRVKGQPNGEIRVTIQLSAPNAVLTKEAGDYVEQRIGRLYDWLEPKAVDPTDAATIRVEPLTKEIPNNEPVHYKVTAMRIVPGGRREANEARQIDVILVTDKNFPAGKYALEVVFANDAPREISGKLLNTLAGAALMAAPDAGKVGADKSLGLRDFKNNLDLAIAFSSSVDQVTQGNRTISRRQNIGILDLRFAPVFNHSLDRRDQYFLTPFFIDAKISTGQITRKNLSLNRILFGTEYSIRWRPNDHRLNKYIFAFRGVNASDRDFKRAEAKFNFEFRPLLNRLNNPLSVEYVTPLPDSVLIPSNGKKLIPTGWFGYVIQPFVGFEVGRVYRAQRTAFDAEEQSRNIRRLFVGTDIELNITKHINLKLSDTAYLRGEDPRARYRNYFIGEFDAPLAVSGDTSQCVFFSFERGDLPPFATPAVNSFKIGYRITSNFFGITR